MRTVAPAVMVVSGASMYIGASFGVLLFAYLPPAGVAWLRVAVSALVLLALARPRRASWTGRPMMLAGVFGIVTALMNICFYEAIARLPLGTAVAIEFLGPIAVVAYESRSLRGVASLLAALTGVVLIADVQLSAQPLGVTFALLAAGSWAAYVVSGRAVAVRADSLNSLAVGWTIAAVVTSPLVVAIVFGWHSTDSVGRVVWMVLALAVLSSVIPYLLDQVLLRMVGRATFALLLALLPVSAVLAGLLILRQVPSHVELLGIACVVLALVVSDHAAERRHPTAAGHPPGQ